MLLRTIGQIKVSGDQFRSYSRSVILMDRFDPDNFSTLQIKGHVLHRARAHLKVPGLLLVGMHF